MYKTAVCVAPIKLVNPQTMELVAVHAQTLCSEESSNDDFCAHLQATVDHIPLKDVPLFAGDLNTRTVPEDEWTFHTLGKFLFEKYMKRRNASEICTILIRLRSQTPGFNTPTVPLVHHSFSATVIRNLQSNDREIAADEHKRVHLCCAISN